MDDNSGVNGATPFALDILRTFAADFKKKGHMKQVFRVVRQTQAVSVQRQDGTQTQKCTLVLQELGGKYENSFAATMLGNMASLKFLQNDVVYACLRFSTREYNQQTYMDCTVQDIVKLSTNNVF